MKIELTQIGEVKNLRLKLEKCCEILQEKTLELYLGSLILFSSDQLRVVLLLFLLLLT